MVGGNLGALAGAKCAHIAVASLTPEGLMLVATAALLVTIGISGPAAARVPEGSRAISAERERRPPNLLGGIGLALSDRYLLLIAVLVVLLNWINSTGEFILADVVSRNADVQVAASGGTLLKGELIAAFYGDFQFWFTLVGVLIQIFLVARIYRWVGVPGALLVLPVIVALGYGLIVFVPIFSMIELVKIAENSVDYSLMNTTRQALFLPVSRDAKYEGKTAIDTFFWRFGDLIQAAVVFAGLHWLQWSTSQFAMLNLVLALVWLGLAGRDRQAFRPALARRRVQRGAGPPVCRSRTSSARRAGPSGTSSRSMPSATPTRATSSTCPPASRTAARSPNGCTSTCAIARSSAWLPSRSRKS
jgi:AAA family ATP:ADP antiporter